MTEQEVMELLKRVGGIITQTHVVLTSERHADTYVNKDAIYPYTKEISRLGRAIAEKFVSQRVEIVIAPAMGGVILAQWVAHHLTKFYGCQVLAVYAEKSKNDDGFVIKRDYDKKITGKRVLVVEDVLTTGGSAKKVIELTRTYKGNVIGIGVICNRGGVTTKGLANVPILYALVNLKLETWEVSKCPLCAQNVPINTSVGKGKEFLAKKR